MNDPINPKSVEEALKQVPFVQVPGAINMRDLGLLPSTPIPSGLIYRSGAIHDASPTSIAALGIKMLLDLRSEREVKRNPNLEIEGVQNVWIEGSKAPSPIEMPNFIEDGGVKAYADMYLEILEIYAPSFRKALEWLRDERAPMVFHCTAGKDRTGVLSALLLRLTGASRSTIAYDYALTRIGIETSREFLLQMLKLWNKDWTPETPGMAEFVQVKGESILGFLDAVEEKYGGVELYVRDVLGFSGKDIGAVKGVLKGEIEREEGVDAVQGGEKAMRVSPRRVPYMS